MLERADNVVIASVISIDGADTKIDPGVGSTYGKMVINNTLYGNLSSEEVVNYLKSGGIMSLEEYEKNQNPNAVEKREEMRKDADVDASKIYYNLHYENDPDIEVGKVYLCYLKYIDELEHYEIIGLENGFRELDIKQAKSVTSKPYLVNKYKIKNNKTGNYESLEEYVNKYIKKVN